MSVLSAFPSALTRALDAAASSVDSLSSTALYALVVGATIGVSLALLGSAKDVAEDGQAAAAAAAAPPPQAPPPSTPPLPEPRWHLFRYMNGLILVAFALSVVLEFCRNDTSSPWWVFLLGWSAFLCYFFGFFGVTFVHDHLAAASEAEDSLLPPAAARRASAPGGGKPHKESSTAKAPANAACLDKGCGADLAQPRPGRFAAKGEDTANRCSADGSDFSDEDVDEPFVQLVLSQQLKDHEIERRVGDCDRAVRIRRKALARRHPHLQQALESVPHRNYDFSKVHGTNCEIVVGYVPIPVGLAGPLTVNGSSYHVPMATTEGCLVASTNRGCKALNANGGVSAVVTADAITRAPCLRLPTATRAAALKLWCHEPDNFALLQSAFESTTSFGKLLNCHATVAGRNVYLRLSCFSGDAMGMNMVSKGSLAVVECLSERFPDVTLVALSGNLCTDKKAAATNWIHGRGKSVVAEATVPASVVQSVLKTTVPALVDTNLQKNLVGSAMAGALGGFNAHASNIVTAVFLATGQDPAQNVESSNCITLMEETENGDLWVSCTLPSLEVGTVGGGTSLAAQSACLGLLGCQGSSVPPNPPGSRAQTLATIVASAVLAGELSLLSALAANTLVQAHMQHNRKKK